MFIAGVVCIIGFSSAFRFFFGSANKMKGTAFFFSGVMCVLLFSPMLGMLVEMVGLYYLFRYAMPLPRRCSFGLCRFMPMSRVLL